MFTATCSQRFGHLARGALMALGLEFNAVSLCPCCPFFFFLKKGPEISVSNCNPHDAFNRTLQKSPTASCAAVQLS